jgi:hypothetical protein
MYRQKRKTRMIEIKKFLGSDGYTPNHRQAAPSLDRQLSLKPMTKTFIIEDDSRAIPCRSKKTD